MPNWCENRMTVRGPKEKIEKFHRLVSMNGLIETGMPMPAILDGSSTQSDKIPKSLMEAFPAEEGKHTWHDWSYRYRGTKWEEAEMSVSDIYEDQDDPGIASVEYYYQSAWNPHIPVGVEIAYDWGFKVFHEYIEMEGCPFSGWIIADFSEEHNHVVPTHYDEEEYDKAYEDPSCSEWMKERLEQWDEMKKEWEEEEEGVEVA